jgi:WD40 repeat protein
MDCSSSRSSAWHAAMRAALLILAGLPAAMTGCGVPPPFTQEDISPDGGLFASPDGAGVILRRTDSERPVRTLSGAHDAPVLAVHFNGSGDRLVSGDGRGKIVVWNPQDGKILGTLAGHCAAIRQIAVRASIPDLASCSEDGTIKLWDLGAFREVRTLSGHTGPVTGLAFAPDGRTLASTSADRTVKLWDVDSGGLLRTLRGHAAAVRAADFDGLGTLLATGSDDGTIKLWDVMTGRELRSMLGSRGPVLNLFMTRNGRWVLAYQSFTDPSSKELTRPLSIWNLVTGDLDVPDYLFEAKLAPPDWPYRAVFQEVAARAAHQAR